MQMKIGELLSLLSVVVGGAVGASCIELKGDPALSVNGSSGGLGGGGGGGGGEGGRGGGGAGGSGSAGTGATGGGPTTCDIALPDGMYCGGNKIAGSPDALYKCDEGKLTLDKICEFGCSVMSLNNNDFCKSGTARQIAEKRLGRPLPARFMIGLGNDLAEDHTHDGVYKVGAAMDIHDVSLYGQEGLGGWADWDAEQEKGSFVNLVAGIGDAKGVVTMFTFEVLSKDAATIGGEQLLLRMKKDNEMTSYWGSVALFLQRLAQFDKPVLVNIEPNLWPYAEEASGGDATMAKVVYIPGDCDSWASNNLSGLLRCWVHLAHTRAPQAVLGVHVSDTTPDAAGFLAKIGGKWADFIVIRPDERDAGCYEAGDCSAKFGPPYYWDSQRLLSHLSWAEGASDTLDKPILWWQLPLGAPSSTPGGTPQHYRDNRVESVFHDTNLFAAVGARGGIGAIFASGDAQQTNIDTDGGQFTTSITKYAGAPTLLP